MTRKRIPPTRYPRTAEVDYRRALIRVYTAWFNTVIRALKESPEFSGLKEARQDANFDDLFDRARDRWDEEAGKLAPDLRRMTENVNRASFLSITEQKKAAGKNMGIDLGVGAIPFDPDIQGEIDASLRENVRLIKSLGGQSLDKIETMVTDTVRQGKLTKELRNQLMEEYKITKRRAALIATDQVGKLNGNINRLRQKKAGVKRYEWNSAQDARVRPEHAKRNGQIYSWDSPPADGHPGQPIRCRCTATPILNDAEDFGLTPEEIAEDLAEQGLIESRQKAAIEARLKASAQSKAAKTKLNQVKGAVKAAKTRARAKTALKVAAGAASAAGLVYVGRKLALHSFEKKFLTPVYATPGLSPEGSYWFDDFGRVMGSKIGLSGLIEYTANEIERMTGLRLTHSHAAGMPLSWDDFVFAILTAKLKEIRAVAGSTKQIISLERVGDVWMYRNGQPVGLEFAGKAEAIHNRQMGAMKFFAELQSIPIDQLTQNFWYDNLMQVAEEISLLVNCELKVIPLE